MFKNLKTILSKIILFLFLLPVFFIYSAYNELFGFLNFPFVLTNFFAIIVSGIIIYFFIIPFFKKKKKSVLFTYFSLTYFLVFGFLHDSLKNLFPADSFFTTYTFLIPFTFLLFISLFIFLKRTKEKNFSGTFFYLNLLMIALIISEIPNSIRRYQLDKSVHNLIDFRFNAATTYTSGGLTDSLKPDIYFLLFDGMASTKSLQKGLGKDNSDLDSFLRSEGFYIASNASANYNWTIHSLSTTFNMDYLPDFIAPVMNDPKAYFWGTNSILNNSLTRILKKEGYGIYQYQPVSFNNKDWPVPSFFEYMKDFHFFFKTFPGRIYRDIFWNYTTINSNIIKNYQVHVKNKRYEKHRLLVTTADSLVKASCTQAGSPKFVYGHFMIPHDPYVFLRNGQLKKITIDQIGKKEYEPDAYFEQLLYADSMIKETVRNIKSHNKPNTIIIVAGDHGFKDFNKVGVENIFGNLNAFYFPNRNYSLLYDSVSPVNTFRIVLNTYFKANLPLVKDSSIIVSDEKNTIISSKMKQPVHNPSSPNQ